MLIDIAKIRIVANIDGSGGTACESRRNSLPTGATAGVRCFGDLGIAEGDFYLYATSDDAITAYTAHLADNGVALHSGDCAAGIAGDTAWYVPLGIDRESPWRIGCFIDGNGEPNLSLVCPQSGPPDPASPVVYVNLVTFEEIADIYPYVLDSPFLHPPRVCSPFTDEELLLVDNTAVFEQGECSPNRGDLPRDVDTAVECVINDGLVARVGLYVEYDEPRPGPEPADLYHERMADYGISPLSGDCAAGIPGDSSWVPIDPPSATSGMRIGCFINENDHANVRLTCPIPNPLDVIPWLHAYIGVLGQTADIAALYEWTMGDKGRRAYMATTQREYPDGPSDEWAKPAICTPSVWIP